MRLAPQRSKTILVFLLGVLTPFAIATVGAAEVAAPTTTDEPRGTLTLPVAIAAALTRSPELEAYSWQMRASEASALQAGLRLNPEFGVEIEDIVGKGGYRNARQAQTTFRLSQVIELGGKRAARQSVATATQELSAQDYEVRRVDVVAEVTECLVHVVGLQEKTALTREALVLAEKALHAVRSRVVAGNLSSLEERKAQIALARSRIEEEHALHELASARYRLAATWGSVTPQFERVDGDLFRLERVPSFDDLVSRLANSPEIQRWVTEKKMRDAEVVLAKARGIPNLTAMAGVRRLEGPDAETLQLQFSIPLPVFDRNQGAAAEAGFVAQHSDANRRAREIRLHAVLFGLYQELVHAATSVRVLQADILPQARDALSLSQRGFEEGRLSYLELRDAQRTFVEARREAIDSAATYHSLLLNIERLLGQAIDTPAAH